MPITHGRHRSAKAGASSIPETPVLETRSRGVLDTPWVHDTSATPARVLWRWDNVMASSALKSALRYTACMQAVYLKTKLRLRSTGRRQRSVGNCGATPGRPRSGRVAMSLSGLSNWPSAGAGGTAVSSWRASRTCETAWAKALRWDIPQSRSLADWRWNMVASSSAMSSIYRFIYHRAAQKDCWHRLLPRRKRRRGQASGRSARYRHQAAPLDHRAPRRGRRPRDAGPLGSRLHAVRATRPSVVGSARTTNSLHQGSTPDRSKSCPHGSDHRSTTWQTSTGDLQDHQLRQRKRIRRTSQTSQNPRRPNLLLRSA